MVNCAAHCFCVRGPSNSEIWPPFLDVLSHVANWKVQLCKILDHSDTAVWAIVTWKQQQLKKWRNSSFDNHIVDVTVDCKLKPQRMWNLLKEVFTIDYYSYNYALSNIVNSRLILKLLTFCQLLHCPEDSLQGWLHNLLPFFPISLSFILII